MPNLGGKMVVGAQVRGHAVDVLQETDDEELRYYLLQLVQALRFEAVDDSRLATFIVHRASRNPVLGILLHWHAFHASNSTRLPGNRGVTEYDWVGRVQVFVHGVGGS